MDDFKTGNVKANGIQFRYIEAGSGPLALCVHGFPDSPWTYRYLLPKLAEAGYRAVSAFNRGYAPTGIPADGDYHTKTLASDVNALHDALGGGSDAVLIAHDWGAVAAYGALSSAPQRWRRAVICNVPPLAVFGQVAFTYPQIKRSFYFWFFQMAVSEGVVAANDLAFIDGLWADWSPGYAAAYDLARVKECLGKPENLRAAMGYYRSLFDAQRFGLPDAMAEQAAVWGQPITHPILYLHGTNDGCIALTPELVNSVPTFCGPGSEAEMISGVGHFMQVEKAAEVIAKILRYLANK